ncbi:tRNA 2-thiouridine(34) synthase MnmA [Planctomycetota bacterium]
MSKIKLLEPSFSPWQPKGGSTQQIAVLMSGGVDSSVTSQLLKQQGWDVLGITMKIPVSCDSGKRGCCGADAALVCSDLGISHYYVDVAEAFNELIIEKFRQAYSIGQTPNPCVDCNTLLKFSLLWDMITATFGIEHLATGHYAKVSKVNGRATLGRAVDHTKDQSYFLYGIARERLGHLVLPLGDLTKEKVRSIAADLGLSVAGKSESMELCFAGEGDYRAVLSTGEAEKPGDLTDMRGNVIGTHKGVANYTLGQRRGLGFAGGKPLYVGKIDPANNIVALGTKDEISSKTATAGDINILIPEEFVSDSQVFAKIRSYSDPKPCKLIEAAAEKMTVEFETEQFAPTPGQKLVIYNADDNIIAGGTIE